MVTEILLANRIGKSTWMVFYNVDLNKDCKFLSWWFGFVCFFCLFFFFLILAFNLKSPQPSASRHDKINTISVVSGDGGSTWLWWLKRAWCIKQMSTQQELSKSPLRITNRKEQKPNSRRFGISLDGGFTHRAVRLSEAVEFLNP